jgi:hypothetical protein
MRIYWENPAIWHMPGTANLTGWRMEPAVDAPILS